MCLWLVHMLLYSLMYRHPLKSTTLWLVLCCTNPTCHHQQDIQSKMPSQHPSLFWGHEVTYRLAMLGRPVPGMRFNKRRLCPQEKGRSSTLIGAYGLSTYPGACWPLLNGISRKSRLCHCLQCGEAVSPSIFLAALETPEWRVNSWSVQNRLLPCRKPSVYPPSQLLVTHGRLGLMSYSLVLVPLCPLDGFLVCV